VGEMRLGEIIDVTHGFAFKGEFFRDEPTGDLLLTPGNFRVGGGFQLGKEKYYSGPVPEDYVLPPGELVVTMTDLSKQSDTLGYPALLPNTPGLRFLHNQRVGRVLIKDETCVDRRFLFYALCTEEYRNEVLASATGTGVKHTAPTRIEAFRFALPPLPEQRAIARVLGGLDDKIELNRRMNRTLEDLARGLFRSWFVDFDPVIKGASATAPAAPNPRVASPGGGLPIARPLWPKRLIDSPLGPIPEGWRVVPLREAFEVNPTRRIPTGAIAAYLDMQNMPTTSAVPDEWVLRACGSGMKFQNGDTLMARITPCLENGKTAYVNFLKDSEVGWGSTEYIVLRSRPHLPPEYSYFLARDEDFRSFAIANMTGSSGRQRVPAAAFDKYLVVVPDPKVAAAFGGFARDVLDRVRMNSEESRKLAATRDALLPTLLSGEVRLRASGDEGRVVREAERAIDDSLQANGQPLRAAQRAAARVKGSE